MGLWTKGHAISVLPSLAVSIVLAIVLKALLGNKERKIRMIPLQVVTVLLVLLEIGKQALSFSKGYDLYHIPLHFCSLFIFTLPAMAFYRGKHCNKVATVTTCLCMAVTGLMLIFPNIIYSEGNVQNFFKGYFDFHTVAFHNLVVCAFVLIVALKLYAPVEKGEQKAVVFFTIGFCVVAASMANLIKVNFANFYTCNVAALEAVRVSMQASIGAVAAQLLYVSINTLLHISFVWGCYRLLRVIRAAMTKKTPVAQRN